MEAIEALKLLRPLAEGIDPFTGEIYSEKSPYQNPNTVRALFLAISALERESKGEIRKKSGRERSGEKWTEKEKVSLLEFFDAKIPIDEIAAKLKRSSYAIAYRLFQNKKITESELAKYTPPGRKANNEK